MINFDTEKHLYTDNNGNEFTSVTRIIHKLSHVFDEDGNIIRAVAKRDGLTVEQVSDLWNKKSQDSLDKGKHIHKVFEDYVNTKMFNPNYSLLLNTFNRIIPKGRKESEIKIWNDKHRIAGTADLLVAHNGKISVFDYKTNMCINFHSKYGNKMKYPVGHLDDCEYNKYSIQLSFYAWMLEQRGENIDRLAILHVPNNNDIIYIPVFYARETIEKIVNILCKSF